MNIYLVWYWEDRTATWTSPHLKAVFTSLRQAKEYGTQQGAKEWQRESGEHLAWDEGIGAWTIQRTQPGRECVYPAYPVDVLPYEECH